MKKSYLALVIVMAFLLNACSTNPLQKKWKVTDVKVPNTTALLSAFKQFTGNKSISSLIPKSFLQQGVNPKELIKQVSFEFKKDEKCELNLITQKVTGTYRLSDDQKTLTINSDDLKMGNKMDVKELSAEKLVFDMHINGQTITFTLQPE